MIVTLDEKRRLTVPLALAPATPGDAFDARFDEEEDAIVFRRVKRGKSWLDVLRACPVSMDDVPARSRALLVQFKDTDGHTLKANLDDRGLSAEEHLGQLLFYDGDELRPCRDRRTLAATLTPQLTGWTRPAGEVGAPAPGLRCYPDPDVAPPGVGAAGAGRGGSPAFLWPRLLAARCAAPALLR